jgi:DNA polymerase-3 subunit delta
VAVLTEEDLADGGARLEEELAAFSMLGGRRLVRIRLLAEGREPAAVTAALDRHLRGELNPEAFFLIEAANLKGESALRRLAQPAPGCGVIACYADDAESLTRMARAALAADGVGVSAEGLEMFVARLPEERGVARQEIERLILFVGPGSGRTADAAELADFFGVEPEASLGEAAVDAFGGRIGATQAGLRRAAQEGETGPAAVRALSAHLGRLRRAIAQHEAGKPLAQVTRDLRIFWKTEREFQRQARTWSLSEIDRVQSDILAADEACKQTGAPDGLIGERLALAIAARARRLGL